MSYRTTVYTLCQQYPHREIASFFTLDDARQFEGGLSPSCNLILPIIVRETVWRREPRRAELKFTKDQLQTIVKALLIVLDDNPSNEPLTDEECFELDQIAHAIEAHLDPEPPANPPTPSIN